MDYMQKVELLYRIIANYRSDCHKKIQERKEEMESDNNDHYLLYNVLGFTSEEGYQVDLQQNVGRFLYKYAGSLMEDLVINCFKMAHSDAESKVNLKNTIDRSPKTVEIDCLIVNRAIEIKWKDATTDGDHIKKEHKRVKIIEDTGYLPIRLMFFEPNRDRAIRIQSRLKDLYEELGGEYYPGVAAWEYLKEDTGIDLREILKKYGKEHG